MWRAFPLQRPHDTTLWLVRRKGCHLLLGEANHLRSPTQCPQHFSTHSAVDQNLVYNPIPAIPFLFIWSPSQSSPPRMSAINCQDATATGSAAHFLALPRPVRPSGSLRPTCFCAGLSPGWRSSKRPAAFSRTSTQERRRCLGSQRSGRQGETRERTCGRGGISKSKKTPEKNGTEMTVARSNP